MDKVQGGRRDGSDVRGFESHRELKSFFFVSIFGLKMALHVFTETEGKFAFDICWYLS